MGALFELCAARGLALIVDETYRDFDRRRGAPHGPLRAGLAGGPDPPLQLLQGVPADGAPRRGARGRAGAAGGGREGARHRDDLPRADRAARPRSGGWATSARGSPGSGRRCWRGARRWTRRWRPCRAGGRSRRGAYFAFAEHPWDGPSDAVARALAAQWGRARPARHDVRAGGGTPTRGARCGSRSRTWTAAASRPCRSGSPRPRRGHLRGSACAARPRPALSGGRIMAEKRKTTLSQYLVWGLLALLGFSLIGFGTGGVRRLGRHARHRRRPADRGARLWPRAAGGAARPLAARRHERHAGPGAAARRAAAGARPADRDRRARRRGRTAGALSASDERVAEAILEIAALPGRVRLRPRGLCLRAGECGAYRAGVRGGRQTRARPRKS